MKYHEMPSIRHAFSNAFLMVIPTTKNIKFRNGILGFPDFENHIDFVLVSKVYFGDFHEKSNLDVQILQFSNTFGRRFRQPKISSIPNGIIGFSEFENRIDFVLVL